MRHNFYNMRCTSCGKTSEQILRSDNPHFCEAAPMMEIADQLKKIETNQRHSIVYISPSSDWGFWDSVGGLIVGLLICGSIGAIVGWLVYLILK